MGLKKCARVACWVVVRKARDRFCSAQCAQLDSRAPVVAPPDSLKVDGNTAEITKRTDVEVRSLEDLVVACSIDRTVWDIKRWVCNKWDQLGDGTGQCFQVKAFLEKKVAVLDARAEIADLVLFAKQELKDREPPIITRLPKKSDKHMLEVNIPDLHAGKMAWGKETGHENYDSHIAQSNFETALVALMTRTASHNFSEVLFVVGNDLLHTDSRANMTTGGTLQDVDGRFHKTFTLVRNMIIAAVERLREVAPVRVLMVPGNHDTLTVWHLGDSLECYFHKYKDVIIDNAPTMRKYHQFGKVMLMFTHGDKGKKQDYPLLMATERPQMFGATTHRECHTGHTHQLRVEERHGVRVRISSALCPPDAWHSENHYVGNARAAEAFVWSADEGLIATAVYTVPAAERAA